MAQKKEKQKKKNQKLKLSKRKEKKVKEMFNQWKAKSERKINAKWLLKIKSETEACYAKGGVAFSLTRKLQSLSFTKGSSIKAFA